MRALSLVLVLLFAFAAAGDGTVTDTVSVAPATWKIASIRMQTGSNGEAAGVWISIHYLDSLSRLVQESTIYLTPAEVSSFITVTNSAVTGESGTAVKRYRQRVTKWLIDNGKIANVTPE